MSYSSLTNKYIPASADNYMRGRGGYKVCKITPHHMACQWSAERCAQSFQVSGRMARCKLLHWFRRYDCFECRRRKQSMDKFELLQRLPINYN
ncbi:MAG: hypothetical protein ACLTTH_12200 [Holdemanella porci]